MPSTAEEVEQVLEACIAGNLDEVRAAVIDRGFSLSSTDSLGVTALHLAALNGHASLVEFILGGSDEGEPTDIDVNALGGEHRATPLYWAASQHHIHIVCKLLNCGGNPTVQDAAGHDCLFLAAMAEDVKMVALFAAHKAPVDSLDKDGTLQFFLYTRRNTLCTSLLCLRSHAFAVAARESQGYPADRRHRARATCTQADLCAHATRSKRQHPTSLCRCQVCNIIEHQCQCIQLVMHHPHAMLG